MKRGMISFALAAMVVAALVIMAAPRAAAQIEGTLTGKILDVAGNPWVGLGIQIVSDQGAKQETKTDKNGVYTFNNLRTGIYTINVLLPNQPQPYSGKIQVTASETAHADFNFKDIIEKMKSQNKEYADAEKKEAEEKQKFEGMKQHFTAGVADLDQARQLKDTIAKTPADQRDAVKQQVTDLAGKAVTELEAAKTAAGEKDPNMHLIMARLGDAYDAAGRADDAIAAYQQAIALKPTAAYYNNLGGILGRTGKVDEATAAYQKSAELDPASAGQAWLNFGITMYNAQKYQEAVAPLQKATELSPKDPRAWYLLAACLVADPSIYKQVGEKIEVTPKPGTIEAYQKAIELDPNGVWGTQAKEGLAQLQQLMGGVNTRVTTKKKKS
ncbi:MAG TPA: tetratricopeptide repeat protein [Candidatus Acidoferrum sp.]|nr:tetratricopeptide repeat protein [Candidatus Acidoferrum sp.]